MFFLIIQYLVKKGLAWLTDLFYCISLRLNEALPPIQYWNRFLLKCIF